MVWVDHVRERKTGPCFPLTVLVCGTHEVGFTLYPPGHVPYGRAAVARVAPDGRAIIDGPSGAEVFDGTVFAAALDASKGTAWDREREGGSERGERNAACHGGWPGSLGAHRRVPQSDLP